MRLVIPLLTLLLVAAPTPAQPTPPTQIQQKQAWQAFVRCINNEELYVKSELVRFCTQEQARHGYFLANAHFDWVMDQARISPQITDWEPIKQDAWRRYIVWWRLLYLYSYQDYGQLSELQKSLGDAVYPIRCRSGLIWRTDWAKSHTVGHARDEVC